MGKAAGLLSWSWWQLVLLTVAGLYSTSRGHQTSCKPWQHRPAWVLEPFPSARWRWPQLMLKGSSSFLPPALQTPKQGGWQPLPDQACPPLDTSFYSQENTQPHKTTKSHRRGTRRMGTALGSAAIPTRGVGTSSLSSPQTLSWCGKLFLGSSVGSRTAMRTGACRKDLPPSTRPGGRSFWTIFMLRGSTWRR